MSKPKPKQLTVNGQVEICDGKLAGMKGRLAAYDSMSGIVMVEIESRVMVHCPASFVEDITYNKPVRKPPAENRPKGKVITENFKKDS